MSLLKIVPLPPAMVEPDATVLDAVRVMTMKGVGAVAVVQKDEKDELRGVFTERDVMLRVVLEQRDPTQTRVRDVMTRPVETVTEETKAEDALNFMIERHIRHLPILSREGQLLGIVSIRNLLQHLVEDLQHQIHSLDQYLLNDGPGG